MSAERNAYGLYSLLLPIYFIFFIIFIKNIDHVSICNVSSTFHTRNTTRHTGISETENLLQNLSLQRRDIEFIVSAS